MSEVLSRSDFDRMRIARLCADFTLLPLDEEMVAFCEPSQCLVALNPSAAFIVHQLQSGISVSEVSEQLVGSGWATREEASRWISAVLETLISHSSKPSGTLETVFQEKQKKRAARAADVPPYQPFEVAAEKHYRLLDTCARVRFARLDQVPRVDSVIGHLVSAESKSPTVAFDIGATTLPNGFIRSYLYKDEQPLDSVTGLYRLAPVIKGAVWEAAVNAYDFRFYVHAGVVGKDENCILLPAAAGSGKSSLTAALAHRGFRYFSDEVALLERGTLKVPPVPLAFCIKKTGWDLIARYFPQLLDMPSHRRGDDKIVRYIPPPTCGVAVAQTSAPVHQIIFPRYEATASTKLAPLSRSEALGRLMAECLALRERLTKDNVEELIAWISAIDCYQLTFSSLDEACREIERVIEAPRRAIA